MQPTNNKALAKLKSIHVSPRKLNLVAQQIRGLTVQAALNLLSFSPKKISIEVRKTLLSAIANAENNHGMNLDKLFVSEASVGKALLLKRFMARAKGRGVGIQKPFSHLTVVVSERGE